ncbi:polycystin-1-like protein 2 [Saccoglossus kowalevskii]
MKLGRYVIYVVVDGLNIAFRKSKLITVLDDCSEPVVRIAGGGKHFNKPQVYYKSENIQITSSTTYDCKKTSVARFRWYIFQITEDRLLEEMVFMYTFSSGHQLIVHQDMLAYGLYYIIVEVTLDASSSKTDNDSVYIEVIRSNIDVNIKGGSERRHSKQRDLIIDASATNDPDLPASTDTHFVYNWICGELHNLSTKWTFIVSHSLGCCFNITLNDTGSVVRVPYNVLSTGWYLVLLNVESVDERSSSTQQLINIVGEHILSVRIVCVDNCYPLVVPSRRSSFIVDCNDCQYAAISYQYKYTWTMYRLEIENNKNELTYDFENITYSGIYGPSIVIHEHMLEQGASYTLRVDVQGSNGSDGYSEIILTTAYAPGDGYCEVDPGSGMAFDTLFYISCHGWRDRTNTYPYPLEEDENTPGMIYTIHLSTNGEMLVHDYYHGMDSFMPAMMLPVGHQDNNYDIDVLLHVENRYGEHSETKLTVTVHPSNITEYPENINNIEETNFDMTVQMSQKAMILSLFLISLTSALKRSATMLALLVKQEFIAYDDIVTVAKDIIETVPIGCGDFANATMEQTENITKDVIIIQDMLSQVIMARMIPGNKIVKLTSRCSTMEFKSSTLHDIPDVIGVETGTFTIRPIITMIQDEAWYIGTRVITYTFNPFVWDVSASNVNSQVISLDLYYPNGSTIKVSNLENPITVTTTHDSDDTDVQLINVDGSYSGTVHHTFSLSDVRYALKISVQIEGKVETVSLYLKYSNLSLESTYEYTATANVIDTYENTAPCCAAERHTFSADFFIPGNTFSRSGVYKIMITKNRNATDSISFLYSMGLLSSSCSFWDVTDDSWKSNGCRVSSLSTMSETICLCDHLTNFATMAYVPVNEIHFDTVFLKFKTLDENATVFCTVIFFIVLYLLMSVYARRQDRNDLLRWKASSLLDNNPDDKYVYEVTVCTGLRLGASTRSNIAFSLHGEESGTGERCLMDTRKKKFLSGSVNRYKLTVPECLGDLLYLRIWHDSSGRGSYASWYLERVYVTDIQTNKTYRFPCEKWLAVDKDDGSVVRGLPVAGQYNLAKIGTVLGWECQKSLTDDHLWISLFLRPLKDNFTRLRRLSCCLCLIFSAMLTNAMYYKTRDDEEVRSDSILTEMLGLVYVATISALIVLPVNMVIVKLFRKSGNAKWPWWVAYIAWTITIIVTLVSAFFIILYSMEWGPIQSEEWLLSFITSYFESTCLIDPIKAIFIAVVISIWTRKADNLDGVLTPSSDMRDVEAPVMNVSRDDGLTSIKCSSYVLDEGKTSLIRRRRDNEKMMDYILRIQTLDDFWEWIDKDIAPSLYNNELPCDMYQHFGPITTGNTHLFGVPRIWQIRNKQSDCDVEDQLTDSFVGKWNTLPPGQTESPWMYTDEKSLKLTSDYGNYRNGGYVAYLGTTLNDALIVTRNLSDAKWLDGNTSAVLMEFMLYNVAHKMFILVTCSFECLAVGKINYSRHINLVRHMDASDTKTLSLSLLVNWVILFGFTCYMAYRSLLSMVRLKRRFFSNLWRWLELCTVLALVTTFGLMIACEVVTMNITNKGDADKFTALFTVSGLYDGYNTVMALLMFLSIVRYLELLRFNKRLTLLTMTLRNAHDDIRGFFIFFLLILTAFAHMGYEMFGSYIDVFSTMAGAMGYLVTVTVGSHRYFNTIMTALGASGKLFLFIFATFNMTVTINIFVGIIISAFQDAKSENENQENSFEMLQYMKACLEDTLYMYFNIDISATRQDPGKSKTNAQNADSSDEVGDRFKDMETKLDKIIYQLDNID